MAQLESKPLLQRGDLLIVTPLHGAQSAGVVEYTDCKPLNECPGYDTKQSDGETPVMQ